MSRSLHVPGSLSSELHTAIHRAVVPLRHEAPLQPRGEPRPAASAQTRLLDLLHHRPGRNLLREDLPPRLVAPDPLVALEAPRLVEPEGGVADGVEGVRVHDRHSSPSRIASTLSGGQVLVVDVIDHHHRRAAARRQALLLGLQKNPPVAGAFPHLDAELVLDVGEDLLAAAQHAGDVGAHRDAVPSDRTGLEHRVEARGLVHPDRRQVEIGGDRVHQLLREVAVILVLGLAQRGQHRRAPLLRWVPCQPVVDLAPCVLAQHAARFVPRHRLGDGQRGGVGRLGHQRSTSPNTTSRVPMIATTSASMWPAISSFMAERCTNPGARTLSRYGLFAPSDTR